MFTHGRDSTVCSSDRLSLPKVEVYVEEIRERKRNPKSPNPKPERKMGKREKDKRRKRKTQRLFPYPQKETSLSLSVPSRFDRLRVYAYSSAPWRITHNKMTSRSPRIMSAPELQISAANDVPAILHDGPDGVPQSGHTRRYCPIRRGLLARAPAQPNSGAGTDTSVSKERFSLFSFDLAKIHP